MKVAIVQFAPKLGKLEDNRARAQTLLHDISWRIRTDAGLDLIVLPEMALSGYNFLSVEAIEPHLELGFTGPSVSWAMDIATTFHCHVCIGFPEKAVDGTGNFNSQVIVNTTRQVVHHYRKSHLYYTDETWATEGDGFKVVDLPFSPRIVTGICMDINPYKFEASPSAYEFANFCLQRSARLVVLSTAWTAQMPESELAKADTPDMDTLLYWFKRLSPLSGKETAEDIIVIFANRCGTEPGTPDHFLAVNDEGDVGYAGTSCVMKFGAEGASVYDMLGRGQEQVLLLNTDHAPKYRIQQMST